jgi:hypothetical protein
MRKPRSKTPFLLDEEYLSVSRTEFRRMPKALKQELMRLWFLQNFEDPAENTPYESAEGGYQYIWGGPYDTREELENKFSGIAPGSLIDEVTNQLDRHGPGEWAPVQKAEDWEDIDWSERYDEPESLDFYQNEPTSQYGSPEERKARDNASTALTRLESSLERRRPIGIGHNQPPEDLDPPEVQAIRAAAHELKVEFGQQNPNIATVKRWAAPLRNALIQCGKWAAKKADKAVDAAMTVLGTAAGGLILSQCFPSLHSAFEAIIQWLEIAAKPLF